MAVYENMLVSQYSYADLLAFKDFLKHKDFTKLDQDILLVVLPYHLHLLSLLMQDK